MNVASPAPAAPALPATPAAGPSNASNASGGAASAEPFAQALKHARGGPPSEAAEAPTPTNQRPPAAERKDATRKPEVRDKAKAEAEHRPGTPGERATVEPGRGDAGPADAADDAAKAADVAADADLAAELPAWLQALAPTWKPQELAAPRGDAGAGLADAAEPATAARKPARAADLRAADDRAAGVDTTRSAPASGVGASREALADGIELQAARDHIPDAGFRGALRAAGGEAAALPPLAAVAPGTASEPHAAGTSAAPGALPERELRAPLHSPSFAPALGAQLTLLVKEGVTEARLHLNPAEMGPIAVQIQLDGAQARVEMVAEQAATRQVLEQSMPALASALRDSGLTLAGGGVFDQASRQPQRGEAEGGRGTAGQGEGAGQGDAADAATAARPAAAPRGVVDVYA